jgi:hypothetical protein
MVKNRCPQFYGTEGLVVWVDGGGSLVIFGIGACGVCNLFGLFYRSNRNIFISFQHGKGIWT